MRMPQFRSDEDEFALLACDGVFDVMRNAEVLEYVRGLLASTNSLSQICVALTEECYRRGSTDNITAVLVRVRHAAPCALVVNIAAVLMYTQMCRPVP
jgi:protein phosphatase 1A